MNQQTARAALSTNARLVLCHGEARRNVYKSVIAVDKNDRMDVSHSVDERKRKHESIDQ